MQRWAVVVTILYLLILVTLTVPVLLAGFYGSALEDQWGIFATYQYQVCLGLMVTAQLALLVVPVRVANRRPVTRRALLWPIIATGFAGGLLVLGTAATVSELLTYRSGDPQHVMALLTEGNPAGWYAPALGLLAWLVWTLVFYKMSRHREPRDLVSRQCRALLAGSILELLIAVPAHVVARNRDSCCGGLDTFIGLAFGISVMLFSFGPAAFFLFVDRCRRIRPLPSGEPRGQVGN